MRMVGAVMVVASAFYLGHLHARQKERRVLELVALLAGLQLLESEVVFGRRLFADALSRVAEVGGEASPFFAAAAQSSRRGEPAARAWESALRAWRRQAQLLEGDWRPLTRLGAVIGVTEAEDQARHFHMARVEIEGRLHAAREQLPKATRLYRALGLSMGLVVVIFLY